MNCFECIIEECSVYNEIFSLFEKLNIPMPEQKTLWNMATKNICCNRFRDVLYALMIKQKNAKPLL